MSIRLYTKGIIDGIVGSLLLILLILVGSRRLLYFDAALVPYLFATLFAVFGIIYRYSVWLSRPPTRLLWERSVKFVFSRNFLRQLLLVLNTFVQQIVLQRFIGKRSRYRWVMHFLLAWGTLLGFAVTFPMVFGWLHFESPLGPKDLYQLMIFGFPAQIFDPHGIIGFLFFNMLNFCSLFIVIGTLMAFTRRFLHPGEIATQTLAHDLLPLLILFSVAVTGLFMSYSSNFLGGQHYRLLSTIHCFTVVVFLVYLPFGKFFHIFQRAAQMGAAFYMEEKERGQPAICIRCRRPFSSLMQKEDVQEVLRGLGFQFQGKGQESPIQDLCPLCRRHMVMVVQDQRLKGKFDVSL